MSDRPRALSARTAGLRLTRDISSLCALSAGTSSDEHELAAGAVGGVPDLVYGEPRRRQRAEELITSAEPQRRGRGQHGAVGFEDVGALERDEIAGHIGD